MGTVHVLSVELEKMKCEIALSPGGTSPTMLAWQHMPVVLPQRGTAGAGMPRGPC